MVLRIVVDGRSATAVTLTELCIRLVRRGPPPVGALLEPPGDGAVVTRYFEVDLDEDPPTVKVYLPPEGQASQRPIDFPYRVSDSDPEVFNIFANTRRHDCSWMPELRWATQGHVGSVVLSNNGRPFRTVSGGAARRYRVAAGVIVPADG